MANDQHLANVARKQAFDGVDNSNTCVKIGKLCKKAVHITVSIARIVLLACRTVQVKVKKDCEIH